MNMSFSDDPWRALVGFAKRQTWIAQIISVIPMIISIACDVCTAYAMMLKSEPYFEFTWAEMLNIGFIMTMSSGPSRR